MGTFSALQTTTVRDFSGGLNVVTDDLNMSTAYSTIETNVYNNINGTKSVRYGTKFFGNYAPDTITFTDTGYKETWYDYSIAQPSDNNKLAVGTYVKLYENESDTDPLIEGYVSALDDSGTRGHIHIYGQTTVSLTLQTVYIDYIKNEIEYKKVKTFYSTTALKTFVRFIKDFAHQEYKYVTIGSRIKINNVYHTLSWINTPPNSYPNYYFTPSSIQNSYTNARLVITTNDLTGTKFINGTYFIDKLVLVTNKGEVCLIDGTGYLIVIFNERICRNINPELSSLDTSKIAGWHDTNNVCFAVFNGILTIWNGRDKPLAVDLNNKSGIYCNYLLDQGTMSNAFVPRAKYAIGFNHYLVAGNIIDEDGTLYSDRLCISAKDAIGTFYTGLSSDVGNDAVNIDLGTIISSNSQSIKGLSRYRNQLVVGFDDVSVFGTLGNYIESTSEVDGVEITEQIHKPDFNDVIDKHGCISNRTFATISSSLICLDYSGVVNFSKRNIAATVLPNRISSLIAPEIYKNYNKLTELKIENEIFGILNPKENQYLLFIPLYNANGVRSGNVCYAYTLNSGNTNILDGAWSKFVGWDFDFGITTALNNVFLGKGLKLYTLGNIDNPIYRDYADDPDYPAQDDTDISGVAIDFIWEMPWTDFGDRAAIKKSKYIALSTTGSAKFNIDMFVDYLYINKETGQLIPSLSMDFVAGDSYGYGNGATDEENLGIQLYGGGRRTNTELLFAWTTKYKIAKFRISGSSKFKLNINSLTIYYLKGNIRR